MPRKDRTKLPLHFQAVYPCIQAAVLDEAVREKM